MAHDRYLKLVLTVIAVALSVIALALVDAPPAANAAAPLASIEAAAPQATSTLPLRWRIPFARRFNTATAGKMDCDTAVTVTNHAPGTVDVDVEFFDTLSNSVGRASTTLPSGRQHEYFADEVGVDRFPFGNVNARGDTGDFWGYGLVFADDPRIAVGAFLYCSEEGTSIASFPKFITNLGAYPVDETLRFLRAKSPAMAPTHPAAEPAS